MVLALVCFSSMFYVYEFIFYFCYVCQCVRWPHRQLFEVHVILSVSRPSRLYPTCVQHDGSSSSWCWGGISRKPLEIETWVQMTTNRKWTIASPMVTSPMTSRDPERSTPWPRYIWCPLSRKWLQIATWWQWSIYRIWLPGNQMVTWPITSRDPERSRSWPQYI